jgi:hypothetical protein
MLLEAGCEDEGALEEDVDGFSQETSRWPASRIEITMNVDFIFGFLSVVVVLFYAVGEIGLTRTR